MALRKVTDNDDFWLLGQGHVAFQLLWSAIELKLFDTLSEGPLALEVLAKKLNLKEYPCRVLLTGLTAVGLLEKNKTLFSANEWAQSHLKNGGTYHKILGWQRHIVYPGLEHLTESLRTSKNRGLEVFKGNGPTLYDRLKNNPDLELVFQNAMSALSTEGREGLLTQKIFRQHKHIMDIGGGDGTNAIHLVKNHPELKMTLLDNESVIERAKKNVDSKNVNDKINFQTGNVFSAKLPSDCDGFIMCHMVTIFSPDENIEILKKCRAALPNGGRMFLFNMFTSDDGSGPMAPALGSPYFLAIASGTGYLYSTGEVREWLVEAGYSDVTLSEELNLNHRLISALK